MKVRRSVAALARVPYKNRKGFFDVIQLPVKLIWELDQRATGTKAQEALIRAEISDDEFEQLKQRRCAAQELHNVAPVKAGQFSSAFDLLTTQRNPTWLMDVSIASA